MTVDSAYYSEIHKEDGGTEYPFEIESVGLVAFEIWYVSESGERMKLPEYPSGGGG